MPAGAPAATLGPEDINTDMPHLMLLQSTTDCICDGGPNRFYHTALVSNELCHQELCNYTL